MNVSRYIGIPYGFDDDPNKSLDCWSLCRHFSANELGIVLPTFLYDKTNEEAYIEAGRIHIANEQSIGKTWKRVTEPSVGDIILIRIKGHPCHCAIFVGSIDGRDSFLHTLRGRNSSIESLTFWNQQVNGTYRYHPS